MDLSEARHLPVKRPVLTLSPRPLQPGRDRELVYAIFEPRETISEYLARNDLVKRMGRQPFVLEIDGRRVPSSLWHRTRPKPGTLITLRAAVRGGGGGKNPLATIAMIALIAYAPALAVGIGGAAAGATVAGVTSLTAFGTILSAGVIVAGGLALNALFPPPRPKLTEAFGGDDSPTYDVTGGSNRARPHQPMPMMVGGYRVFPDLGALPYTEFIGDDQYLFQIFDFGYNDVELSQHKIGETLITDYEGVLLEESGPDGKLRLFPGNVDSVAGAELTAGVSWITRTTSPNTTAIAVEITGALFHIDNNGNVSSQAVIVGVEARKVGETLWTPLEYTDDHIPTIIKATWEAVYGGQGEGGYEMRVVVTEEVFDKQAPSPNPGEITFVNASRKPLRRTLYWPVAEGQYEVRVRRVTADVNPNSNSEASAITWSQLRSYQADTADYTGRKRVALRIKASGQLNGVVEEFNAISSAKCSTFDQKRYAQRTTGSGTANISHVASQVTVAAWVRVGSHINWHNYLNHGWVGDGWLLFSDASGLMSWGVGKAGAQHAVSSNSSFAAGTWVHVVGTYDDATVKIYINGVKQTSEVSVADAASSTAAAVTFATTNQDLAFPAVWNRALSAAEISALYANGVVPTSNLAGYWPLQEESGAVGEDVSGNEADITWSAAPAHNSDGPTWWHEKETSNPAWWFLASARGKFSNGRRVWGAGMPDTRIDIASLQAFATWCDAEGLTVNGVFDQQLSVMDMLSQIALMGRGTLSWATGKLGVIWDAPDQPVVAVFGMHNIIPGSFEIEYATEELADQIEGTFNNPVLGYKPDVVRATVPGATELARIRRVQHFLCTDKEMATQLTNLYAAQNAYRTRRYRWRTDWEGMPAARGDVVQLSHDLASLDYSGRFIEGGDASTLKLPKNVPLYAGGSFILIVRPNGATSVFDIEPGVGESNTLTLTTPFGGGTAAFNPYADVNHPPYDYKWLYGPTATPGKKVKIDRFKPINERTIEITAIDEVPEFYAAKDNAVEHFPPRPSFGAAPALSDLQFAVEGVRAGVGYMVRVTFSWSATGDYGHADVRVSVDGEPLRTILKDTRATSAEIFVRDDSAVAVEITAYSSLGNLGQVAKLEGSQTVNFAALAPPSDVASFSLHGDQFSWPLVPDEDVVGYRIRFYYGTAASWDVATPLHVGLVTESPWRPVAFPKGQVTFLLKAVDAAGLESTNPAVIVKGFGDLEVENVVIETDFKAQGWLGTLTDGIVDGSNHLVADSVDLAWNANGAVLMWDENDATLQWGGASYKQMTYEDSVTVPFEFVGVRIILDHDITGDPFTFEYRDSGPAVMWDGLDSDLMWTGLDADSMWGPFPDYKIWMGEVLAADATTYDFRLVTGQGATQGVVREFKVLLDVEDMVESVGNIVVPAEGIRIPLTRSFHSIRVTDLTLEDDGGVAVSAKWLDKDPVLGPLIKCFDKDNNPTSGVVDAIVQGY